MAFWEGCWKVANSFKMERHFYLSPPLPATTEVMSGAIAAILDYEVTSNKEALY